MNWAKIKNIMIFILVVINLFLIIDMAVFRFVSQSLPDSVEESFINILDKNGIRADKRVISNVYEKRSIISSEIYDIDYMTEIFVGDDVNYVSENDGLVAALDDKKLTLNGYRIEYSTLRSTVDKNGRDIMKALNNLGLDMSDAYYDAESGYVKRRIDSIRADGIYLDVLLDQNGEIAHLAGVWPKITVEGFDEKVSVIEAVNSICKILPIGSEIVKIEPIYLFDAGEVQIGWLIYNQGRGYKVTV